MNGEHDSVVCTLFEGDYHYGLGTLINSLVRNGFRGKCIIGYRGALPPWVSQLSQTDGPHGSEFAVGTECRLIFVLVDTPVHFTNYKPRFLIEVLDRYAPEAERIYYFDPDIVIFCRWSFFDEWVRDGVALCEDVNGNMPNDHPVRNAWRRHFASRQIELPRQRDKYYNAGFIGLSRATAGFVAEWQQTLEACEYDAQLFVGRDRTQPFNVVDQDALNITVMRSTAPLTTVGPDGMDFQPGGGGFIMAHAIGKLKPWNHSFTWNTVVLGGKLRHVDRLFLDYAMRPIAIYSQMAYRARLVDRYVSGILSRVIG